MSEKSEEEISNKMKEIAEKIKEKGEKLAEEIREWYEVLAEDLGIELNVEKESRKEESFWLAVVLSSRWIIGGMDWKKGGEGDEYIKQVFQLTRDPSKRSDEDLRNAVFMKGFRGSRKNVVYNMLKFYAKELDNYNASNILANPVVYQKKIIKDAEETSGVGHWMATVPFKVLAFAGLLPNNVINDLEPPIGSSVRRGIKIIFGIDIDEMKKSDREIVTELHRHLAKLAGTNIFIINSGLWSIGL